MELLIGLGILLFSAILHELAHGYMADRLGDPTPRLSGRLTLNPRNHIDPWMSIALPALLLLSGSPIIFGGAKPVPVDPYNLKEGPKDIALVALSGPLTNILIAIAAALLIKAAIATGSTHPLVFEVLGQVLNVNLMLAIFNLLPIPPLDGSKVVAMILPNDVAASYLALGRFGTFLLLFLLLFPIGGFSIQHILYTLFTFSRGLLLP